MNKILEISKRAVKGGRVPIKIALLKIHEDSTETNLNGIHWYEEYVKKAMETAKMMPICAEFYDETKETPSGHGLTGTVVNEDGIQEPVFENSETVGVIESAEISTVSIDGTDTKVLLGSGYLYNQRYPNFVKWVRKNFALNKVDTSIEIMGYESNENKIVYLEDSPAEEFRTPKEFVFSGTAILSVAPSDSNAIVIEVAQKQNKEEEQNMTEQEIMDVVQKAITETNSVKANMNEKVNELNNQLVEKDNTISELNASISQLQKALDDLKTSHETYWEERELIEKELVKAKVSAKLGELDSVVGEFNEAEQEVAKDDIDALKATIEACEKKEELENATSEINSIKSKICMAIVERQKKAEADAKIAEQNSAKEAGTIDIFSEINSNDTNASDEETNIF